ncbi:MAG: MarC family protein [Opitutaceae bacterium]
MSEFILRPSVKSAEWIGETQAGFGDPALHLAWPARACPGLGDGEIGRMSALGENFLKAFIPLFVAIDPIGLAAIFLAMSTNVAVERRKKIANQAAWTGGLVALLFLFLGQTIFAALGITVNDFQIAGGLILFILAAKDLIQSAAVPEAVPEDFGVVPLGMPLIAGPASITTLLVLAQSQTIGLGIILAALAVNLVLVVLAFAYSDWLGQKIGGTGLRAISKIIALLLAAIAVNMIRQGLAR